MTTNSEGTTPPTDGDNSAAENGVETTATAQAGEPRSSRRGPIIGIAVAVIAVACIILVVVLAMKDDNGAAKPAASASATPTEVPTASAQATTSAEEQIDQASQSLAAATLPKNANELGALKVGDSSAPVTVTIFVDYHCSYCAKFEEANGEMLGEYIDNKKVTIEYYPVAFLSEYSQRATVAAGTVFNGQPEVFWKFSQVLFDNYDKAGQEGFTTEQLATMATEAGVRKAVVDQFSEDTFVDWAEAMTEMSFARGLAGTPTVFLNGEQVASDSLYADGALKSAIDELISAQN